MKGEGEVVMAEVAGVGAEMVVEAVEGLVMGQKWVVSGEVAADEAEGGGVVVVVGAAPPSAGW